MTNTIIAIDPGREKCGVAALNPATGLRRLLVVATQDLSLTVDNWKNEYNVQTILIGNGTAHAATFNLLKEAYSEIEIVLVDEKYTTEAARVRYWQENPPRGLKRLLPTTMLVPPEPVDAYAALIMAERFLANSVN